MSGAAWRDASEDGSAFSTDLSGGLFAAVWQIDNTGPWHWHAGRGAGVVFESGTAATVDEAMSAAQRACERYAGSR